MILKIPVPRKYFMSPNDCNLSFCGEAMNKKITNNKADDHARSVTTSIGVNPSAYKCLTYQPIVPHKAAPMIM